MKDNSIKNLYQTNKADKPPKSLDNFILAHAKNSCDEKQILHNTPMRKRWLFRLSTAAVVVLSFSIILNMQTENELMSEPPQFIQKSKQNRSESIQNKTEDGITSLKPSTILMQESAAFDVQENKVSGDAVEALEEEISTDTNTIQETVNRSMTKETPDAMPVPVQRAPTQLKRSKNQLNQSLDNKLLESVVAKSVTETEQLGAIVDDVASPDKNRVKTENTKKKPNKKISAERYSTNTQSANVIDSEDVINYSTPVVEQLTLTQYIEQLDSLIENQKLTEAKQLLKQLQGSYPDYDFSKHTVLLENH